MRFNFALVSSFLLASTVAARASLALRSAPTYSPPDGKNEAGIIVNLGPNTVNCVSTDFGIPPWQGEGGSHYEGLVVAKNTYDNKSSTVGVDVIKGNNGTVCRGFSVLPDGRYVYNALKIGVGDFFRLSICTGTQRPYTEITDLTTGKNVKVPVDESFSRNEVGFLVKVTSFSVPGYLALVFNNVAITMNQPGTCTLGTCGHDTVLNIPGQNGGNLTSVEYTSSSISIVINNMKA